MSKFKKFLVSLTLIVTLIGALFSLSCKNNRKSDLPSVAIANWGPHSSLDAAIQGFKEELENQGFIDNKNIKIHVADVNFDTALIPQMVMQLKGLQPNVIVTIGTPVSQFVKSSIKEIPLVFSVITDPVEAGLLDEPNQATPNATAVSDKQDLDVLLDFVKKLLPNSTRVGILYATSEANDIALVNMLKNAADKLGMTVLALPINQGRDVPMQMKMFKDQVDFIYVGASGPIQPTLPAIVSEADKMGIPIFNVDEDAVQKHQVLASFGVDYKQVGTNIGKLVTQILNGEKISNLPPLYANAKDHRGFISSKKAKALNIEIPSNLPNTNIVN